jgi:F-box and WD-40 domain protein 1/11
MLNLLQDLDLQEMIDSGVEVSGNQIKLDFISLLPTELSIQIFKYVDSIQMFKLIPLVSSRWHKISQDNDVWRSLFVQRWGRPKNQIKAFIEKDWKALYKSRLELNENWSKGNVSTTCLSGHLDSVYCIQYDDSILLSGSRDQTIKFWSLKTKECFRTLTGHRGSVLCLQYNSKYIITGSSDSTIIVWDYETGSILQRLSGHSLPVLDVRFDGNIIASCSKDSLIKIWDLYTGNLIRYLCRN